MGNLDGKVALVTGAGRGIGLAISQKLAREGARVVVNDLDPEPAQDAVARLEANGGQAAACVGNVTESGFAQRFVDQAIERFGRIDVIVNNAGYTWDSVIQKMTDEQFQAMLDVHLVAPFRILRAAAPYIRSATREEAEQGLCVHRKVVNVSSITGIVGLPGQANYSSAKAGIIGLTKTMAKEWGRYKVNVNCVAFGHIDTRLTATYETEPHTLEIEGREIRTGIPKELVEAYVPSIPLGRVGTPDDAAGAVYLLCTPESDYISGQVLQVTGGAVE
ncbi:MAG: SDR family oxidoreductase [Rhizobiales bacterium]|nr:SDR family oxidoreductase [Hyphomicrobiales bacterium]